MHKVIINASPIISLCKIGLENMIFELFDEIYTTDEVIEEINKKQGNESVFLNDAISLNKIKKYTVLKKDLINELYGKMHKGELSVIIGGLELNIDNVIIDEIAARNFSESLSLSPIGTIGILRIAKRKGMIVEIKPYLNKLKENGFWLSNLIMDSILKMENELI